MRRQKHGNIFKKIINSLKKKELRLKLKQTLLYSSRSIVVARGETNPFLRNLFNSFLFFYYYSYYNILFCFVLYAMLSIPAFGFLLQGCNLIR